MGVTVNIAGGKALIRLEKAIVPSVKHSIEPNHVEEYVEVPLLANLRYLGPLFGRRVWKGERDRGGRASISSISSVPTPVGL